MSSEGREKARRPCFEISNTTGSSPPLPSGSEKALPAGWALESAPWSGWMLASWNTG